MKIRICLLASLLITPLLGAVPVHAATVINAGDLVKIASQPDVYYVGPDMKRYVFPNEKTYFSWYTGFDTKTISDMEMASLSIGGAVTYRPGTRMIKLTTDPKTYAVDAGGVLRWIENEAVATSLYGSNWNTKIDDLPDAFLATYKYGPSIGVASAFNPSNESAAAVSIAVDKGLISGTPPVTPPPPTQTATSTLDLIISKNPASAGDIELLTASGTSPTGVSKIDLFFGGVLIKTCAFSPCAGETQIPLSGTLTSYDAKAVFTAMDTSVLTKTVTVPIGAVASNLVTVSVGRSIILTGQAGEAIVDADASVAVLRTDIFVGGTSVKACATASHECRWSDVLTGSVGTVYDVYGQVTDTLGRTYNSVHKTITIGLNDSPAVTVAAAKPLIYVGETVDVTVSATDDNGIAKIEVMKDGVVLKTCESATPCTITTGPWMSAGTLTFSGRATDTLGLLGTGDPISVTVQ